VDAGGNLYIADNTDHRVRRVGADGLISTVAGNGHAGVGGDQGPAVRAQLNSPYGVALDGSGNLYVAEFGNARVRRVAADGTITTVAAGARFAGPRNVAVDGQGNLYVADHSDHRVYRISPAGQISPVAGTGAAGFNGDGPALAVRLNFPAGLAVDRAGALYIADSGNKSVRRLFNGQLTTVLGPNTGNLGLEIPVGVAVDGNGNLYVADSQRNRVFRLAASGAITTVAGAEPALEGPVRDVAVSGSGVIYFSSGRRVMRVNGATVPVPVAGDGTFGVPADGVLAAQSYLASPIGLALDDQGNLYVAEESSRRVRRIDRAGIIQTVAGGGTAASLGDGGLAVNGRLVDPVAVAADSLTGLRIADYLGFRIRGVLPSGILYTLAGNGEPGLTGDGGPAQSAQVNRPRGLALDREGNLYFADSLNHRVRRILRNGFIETVAGNGVRGYGGDYGAARQAHLNAPLGVAVDGAGNVYIADSGNHAIRRVNPAGVIVTLAGTGAQGFSGDGGQGALAQLNAPAAVAVDAAGNLVIADTFNHRIRLLSAAGVITTIGGDGVAGFAGDGGAALEARFRGPSSVVIDAAGNILVADLGNHRIRRLSRALAALPPAEQMVELVVMNAASFRSGALAPGTLVSIFGAGIGPENSAGAALNGSGAVGTKLAGAEVRFDGTPAPILFANRDQINVQAPYAIHGRFHTQMEVLLEGRVRGRIWVPVAASSPALFTLDRGLGQAVAVNQDGTLNGAGSPALRGSVMTLYATGGGLTEPGGQAGVPARAPLPRPLLEVRVLIGTREAEILYAGAAPGFVGLLQINVRLPGLFSPPGVLPVTVFVGEQGSQSGVTVALQ